MKLSFRNKYSLLQKVSEYLENPTEENLLYSALLLRMSMEAYSYEILNAWKTEIYSEDYKKWQPQKIIELLSEYEPYINENKTIIISEEKEVINSSEIFEQKALPIKFIKTTYHKLGKYIHFPHPDKKKELDIEDRARTLKEIYNKVNEIISDGTIISTLGQKISFECSECKKTCKLSKSKLLKDLTIKCFNTECNATYDFSYINDKPEFKLQQEKFECTECKEIIYLDKYKIKNNSQFSCLNCSQEYLINEGFYITKNIGKSK